MTPRSSALTMRMGSPWTAAGWTAAAVEAVLPAGAGVAPMSGARAGASAPPATGRGAGSVPRGIA
ncbi:MAG TPA: hypothetical protein VFK69_10985, partial [Candidatus Eisenbacteria bacterium]|nr:hypothetical protein [Candidatus Eisenbacteria bacterium]